MTSKKLRTIAFLSSILALFNPNMATADQLKWSFADHPHPQNYKLTSEEKIALNSIKDKRGGIELCGKIMQTQFAIYGKRYPRFEESGSVENRFSDWKLHLLNGNYYDESECITEGLYLKVFETKYDVGLVYCGILLRSPQTEQEYLFVESLEQLVSYSHMGVLAAMNNLLHLHKPGSAVSFNPDIELYIRKFLHKNDKFGQFNVFDGVWYTGHLEPLLTPERIEFVNTAVERGDFAAVLETTAPCPVRPQ